MNMRKLFLIVAAALTALGGLAVADPEVNSAQNDSMAQILVIEADPFTRAMAGEEEAEVHPTKVENVETDPFMWAMAGEEEETVHPAEVEVDHGTSASDDETQPASAAETTYRVPGTDIELQITPEYNPYAREYRIRTGDSLSISIPYEAGSSMTVPVRPDGRVTYLFDIELVVAGLTYAQVNKVLREKLRQYYKNPNVTVVGTNFAGHSVFVMGPVKSPGKHVIANDTRLLEILSICGAMSLYQQTISSESSSSGERELIDLQKAYLVQDGKVREDVDFSKLLIDRDMSQNVILKAGDFIYLPRNLSADDKRVYVVGRVSEELTVRYTGTITFLEAIVEAGGAITSGSWVRRCFIIRGGVKTPKKMIRVNLPAVQSGRTPDVPLENGDIIFVPKTPLFKVTEILNSVLAPLNAILTIDDIGKNRFHEGSRQWKHILSKSRALGAR